MTTSNTKIKDPGSAVTHFIGALLAIGLAIPLLIKASHQGLVHFISLTIFIFSMIQLYVASTLYHTINASKKINRRLRKFDHMAIYILIAGTYTPICLIALGGTVGIGLLVLIWSLAAIGLIVTAFWVNGPKWLSSIIYIAMGWTCVLAFGPIINTLPRPAFLWLLVGGIVYTIGGIIYALKLPLLSKKFEHFGLHEIFHLFVMAGSFCHYLLMYKHIVFMP